VSVVSTHSHDILPHIPSLGKQGEENDMRFQCSHNIFLSFSLFYFPYFETISNNRNRSPDDWHNLNLDVIFVMLVCNNKGNEAASS
jgi:hypothetical protein